MRLSEYAANANNASRVSTQARLDIRHLAAFARFFDLSGTRPESRSHLIHMIVGIFNDLMIENGSLEPVLDNDEAYRILSSLGIEWNKDSPSMKQIMQSLQQTDNMKDGFRDLSDQLSAVSLTPSQQMLREQIAGLMPRNNDDE